MSEPINATTIAARWNVTCPAQKMAVCTNPAGDDSNEACKQVKYYASLGSWDRIQGDITGWATLGDPTHTCGCNATNCGAAPVKFQPNWLGGNTSINPVTNPVTPPANPTTPPANPVTPPANPTTPPASKTPEQKAEEEKKAAADAAKKPILTPWAWAGIGIAIAVVLIAGVVIWKKRSAPKAQ